MDYSVATGSTAKPVRAMHYGPGTDVTLLKERLRSDAVYRKARHFEKLPSGADAISHFLHLNDRAEGIPVVETNRPIVLYGAGNLGALARDHLELAGCPPILVIDRNADAYRFDAGWANYHLCTPERVPAGLKQDALLAVSISTSPFVPLLEALAADGWQKCVPFYDLAQVFHSKHPLNNGWVGKALTEADMALTQEVIETWADDRSRADHLRFAAWRLCREELYFAEASVDIHAKFFIPEVAPYLTPHARVVDGGAHHGSYIERLVETTDAIGHIWAVEPDPSNLIRLRQSKMLRAAVSVHDAVLSDKAESVPFHCGLGYASQISATGAVMRRTTTLDEMNLNPTVIKLHLEGHELAALKGAERTIQSHRPLVMATVYHNEDGLFRTADWMMSNLDGYRFLLRAHGWCGTGLIIYGLPDGLRVS